MLLLLEFLTELDDLLTQWSPIRVSRANATHTHNAWIDYPCGPYRVLYVMKLCLYCDEN